MAGAAGAAEAWESVEACIAKATEAYLPPQLRQQARWARGTAEARIAGRPDSRTNTPPLSPAKRSTLRRGDLPSGKEASLFRDGGRKGKAASDFI